MFRWGRLGSGIISTASSTILCPFDSAAILCSGMTQMRTNGRKVSMTVLHRLGVGSRFCIANRLIHQELAPPGVSGHGTIELGEAACGSTLEMRREFSADSTQTH